MRYLKVVVIFVIGVICARSKSYAQDPFFSQFYNSPLTLNPALTGISYGNIRAGINYKDYLNDFAEIQTYALSVDMSLMEADRNPDFAGVGLVVLQDKAGNKASNTRAMLSYAYHNAIGANGNSYLVLGLQAGLDAINLDYSQLSTQSQWVDFQGYNPELSNGEAVEVDSKAVFDMQAGLLFYSFLKNNNTVFGGVSAAHMTAPDRSLLGQRAVLERKYIVHGGAKIATTQNINIVPTAMFFTQGNSKVISAGVSAEYTVNENNAEYGQDGVLLSLGGWIRNTDTITLGMGFEYGTLNAGLSYDLITSSLGAQTRNGGLEISLAYAFKKKFKARTKTFTNPTPRL